MTEAGHDRYWTGFLLLVAAASLVLMAVVARQVRRLSRLAAAAQDGGMTVRDAQVRYFGRILLPLWGRASVLTLIAFLVQENVETASVGGAMPGLGVVSGDHAMASPVIALVTFVIAAVGALVRWRRDVLLARLRATRAHFARVPIARPAVRDLPVVSASLARRNGVRAPPAMVAAPA